MMTAEEKRERILKRALPAMFITIIYFVFVSDIMGEQRLKAQEEYDGLMRKGITPAALPGIYERQSKLSKELRALKEVQAKYVKEIKAMAGFLSGESDAMDSATLLANILSKHHVRVVKEVSETFPENKLPVSLKEVRDLLKESLKAGKEINVQHLWLRGEFRNMHAALKEINEVKLAAIPVVFTLSVPDDVEKFGLSWELVLWM